MTNPILQPVNPEDCPPSTHPDKHLFRPMNASTRNRQEVYSFIQKRPSIAHVLSEIVLGTKLSGKEVYAAARVLCKKNFATRHEVDMVQKTKKGDKPVKRIGIKFVDPWSTKLSKKW